MLFITNENSEDFLKKRCQMREHSKECLEVMHIIRGINYDLNK